ncbi:hypothetical protein GCK72_009967 [Caenorhabditis remanei]|uniref:Uncharacterized protein n=1 Tax=Caenorhabditis remanei TaxID=31234 RepID=A0A6A5H420_CAERE|nr:hypothetical protein GCK72_009967 [Caenorhabditis remanei]KAF1761711.1 hypothetical protein GCK72_009967 [Caenorhabditis remanei]
MDHFRWWLEKVPENLIDVSLSPVNIDPHSFILSPEILSLPQNWASGKSVFDFKQLLLWGSQVRDQSIITRGLEMRPWDDDFRKEARGFCDDFDRCCGSGLLFQISRQIDPFESLTLCISEDCTSIYATGKRITWGGKTYTNYSIPSL